MNSFLSECLHASPKSSDNERKTNVLAGSLVVHWLIEDAGADFQIIGTKVCEHIERSVSSEFRSSLTFSKVLRRPIGTGG